ncbi:metalloregulator ArsR/SmtB family transcription factor [Mesorhizobium sp. 1M-11]|uniref:ArsR/SmtB family transcription factor n=1 Tax=Mesorhizobium sp. 1M-11 TaxID=1529006 RepID=UPI0006C73CD1|nr:metalloregulator ArsR/SmtB family transcription factor [Mesorhizobium sp. 1M-11]
MARTSTQGDVFAAIADPTRRRLLERIGNRERSVAELTAEVGATLANVSLHLQVLTRADLVRRRAAGRQRLYRLNLAPLMKVTDWAAQLSAFWNEKLDGLGELAERLDAEADQSDI